MGTPRRCQMFFRLGGESEEQCENDAGYILIVEGQVTQAVFLCRQHVDPALMKDNIYRISSADEAMKKKSLD